MKQTRITVYLGETDVRKFLDRAKAELDSKFGKYWNWDDEKFEILKRHVTPRAFKLLRDTLPKYTEVSIRSTGFGQNPTVKQDTVEIDTVDLLEDLEI